jgi:hypothetical protein
MRHKIEISARSATIGISGRSQDTEIAKALFLVHVGGVWGCYIGGVSCFWCSGK